MVGDRVVFGRQKVEKDYYTKLKWNFFENEIPGELKKILQIFVALDYQGPHMTTN